MRLCMFAFSIEYMWN